MKVRIYVEGGGDGRDLRTRCRKGFSAFFEKAGLAGRMPGVVACGSRAATFDRFLTAFGARKAGEFVVLLVDSEAPVADDAGPWRHLAGRHSFAVLERTDPAKVLAASPHAERLIDTLREKAT